MPSAETATRTPDLRTGRAGTSNSSGAKVPKKETPITASAAAAAAAAASTTTTTRIGLGAGAVGRREGGQSQATAKGKDCKSPWRDAPCRCSALYGCAARRTERRSASARAPTRAHKEKQAPRCKTLFALCLPCARRRCAARTKGKKSARTDAHQQKEDAEDVEHGEQRQREGRDDLAQSQTRPGRRREESRAHSTRSD